MKARTKDYPAGSVIAFGGFEYVRYEYRVVPLGFEDQAEAHLYLEIEQEPEPVAMPEPVEPVTKPKAKRKRTPRKRTIKTPQGDK